jgi:hypothetical protein
VIPFHRLLIATGILFTGGFALWALVRYPQDGPWMLALAGVSGAAAAALAFYLRHLRRFLGR